MKSGKCEIRSSLLRQRSKSRLKAMMIFLRLNTFILEKIKAMKNKEYHLGVRNKLIV